jgi:hypothetical protein
VNASGTDSVPPELEKRYKDYVVGIDYNQKTLDAYNKIWDFHCWLKELGVKHVMYNGWSTFSDLPNDRDWDRSYIGPYDRNLSYNSVLTNNGFEWVTPFHYHFGAKAHRFWASYVLQYIKDNQLLDPNEISTY